jgi:hypothetical protein
MYCNGSEELKSCCGIVTAAKSAQNCPKVMPVQAKLRIMKSIRLFFSAVTLFICTASLAQYQWIDANGRKVFSDQPPPASVPAKNVLQQPGKVITVPAASTQTDADGNAKATTAPAAVATPAPKTKPVDKELEAKKKLADEAEAAKKAVEEEKIAKARADNCLRAKSSKAGLASGIRIAVINSKGEREVMDTAARMVETKRIEGIIQSDCK